MSTDAVRDTSSEYTYGFISAFAAYFIWGFFPFYFKTMAIVDPVELAIHRVLWSALCLVPILFIFNQHKSAFSHLKDLRNVLLSLAGSVLIAGNWLVFVYGVLTDRVLDASLGYFIVPLVNAGLGMLFFKEKFNKFQISAIALATVGVFVASGGQVSWIALLVALTFGFYGLVRKLSDASPLSGLFVEALIISPFALAYLLYMDAHQGISFLNIDLQTDLLLGAAGLISVVPLALMIYGTKRIEYSTIGFLQYIAPIMHFGFAILVFGEILTETKMITFAVVWSALALFLFGLVRSKTS